MMHINRYCTVLFENSKFICEKCLFFQTEDLLQWLEEDSQIPQTTFQHQTKKYVPVGVKLSVIKETIKNLLKQFKDLNRKLQSLNLFQRYNKQKILRKSTNSMLNILGIWLPIFNG